MIFYTKIPCRLNLTNIFTSKDDNLDNHLICVNLVWL
jgi:hypothetical protein